MASRFSLKYTKCYSSVIAFLLVTIELESSLIGIVTSKNWIVELSNSIVTSKNAIAELSNSVRELSNCNCY